MLQIIKSNVVTVYSLSHVQLFATPWTIDCQEPLSIGFLMQEHLSGLPVPSPGNLLKSGIKRTSPGLADRFCTTESPGKPIDKERVTK